MITKYDPDEVLDEIRIIDSFYATINAYPTKAGVYYCERKKNRELKLIWICSILEVKSLKNNNKGEECYELKWVNRETNDGSHTCLIPTKMLLNKQTMYKRTLAYEGLSINKSEGMTHHLTNYIESEGENLRIAKEKAEKAAQKEAEKAAQKEAEKALKKAEKALKKELEKAAAAAEKDAKDAEEAEERLEKELSLVNVNDFSIEERKLGRAALFVSIDAAQKEGNQEK